VRVVAALGGNALIRRGQAADADVQRENLAVAVRALAELAREHELIVTHGNGPQVGLLALQTEAYLGARPYPLDVLGAESEGMIGYMLEQGMENELPGRRVATLLTQVVVDPADPAFQNPTKPIGPVYEQAEAERLSSERGFRVARDGAAFRRVVPSPEPLRIVEVDSIRILVEAGVIVVCAGGGGVPVAMTQANALIGLEAVIDKDLAAALLARELGADVLMLLTDVPAVEAGWGTAQARPLARASPAELRGLGLASGSMGPKAEAAARFADAGGRAVIAAIEAAPEALAGVAGTTVELARR
jgi:carbamate kinase